MDILGLHIIRPYFLLLIIPVILIFLYAIKSGKISSSWQKICDDHLLKYLSVKSAKGNRKMISVWGLIAALFAVFALTGMAINKIPVSSFSKTNPTLIALNVSSKMNVKDFSPNRLQRAKFEIIDFTKMLAEKGEFELGLMVFSDEPYMITPMSDDEKLIENIISQIDFTIMPSDGIRIDRVIDSAIEVFENNGLSYGRLIIITPEKGQKFDKALAKAKEFYGKYKSKIYVMGMSTKDGAPVMRMPHLRSSGDGEIKVSRLDADALNRIAKNGGGEFVKVMSDDSDWGKILDDGDRLLDGNMMKEMKNKMDQWDDFGFWLLIIPIIYVAGLFRRGFFIIFFVFSFGSYFGEIGNVWAGNLKDMFLNDNQRALNDYQKGDFESAIVKFDDDNWRAATSYRLKDFKTSIVEFENLEQYYNMGNALAFSGDIKGAIKAYEKELEINPENEDAKFNKELLEKMQNQGGSDNQEQQNQSSENERQDDKEQQSKNQESQKQNQSQADGEENQENKKDEMSNGFDNEKQEEKKASEKEEQVEVETMSKDELEEKIAKEQIYREIPEDNAGLLRAFIRKRYLMERYNEK